MNVPHQLAKLKVTMPKSVDSRFSTKPKAIDCFAGCGGMSKGLALAGFEVVGAIEREEAECETYGRNHPRVHLWKQDICDVSAADVLRQLGLKKGELDLLAGCPPCQGFSTLRTFNGKRRIREAQNDLIFEMLRLIEELRPKHVMLENVPKLLRNHRLKSFRASLRRAGYHVRAKVLDVAKYGIPQRRKRLVLLASRLSDVQFAKESTEGRTVRTTIENLAPPGHSGDPIHDLAETRSQRVKEIIRAIPKDGGSRSALPSAQVLDCHTRSDGFKDVYGRMAWDKPAPTITTGCFNPSKGRFLHPQQDRTITLREAALLQSFPKTYKFPLSAGKVRIATMIGNALPPRFIMKHARQLLKLGDAKSNRKGKSISSRGEPYLRPPRRVS